MISSFPIICKRQCQMSITAILRVSDFISKFCDYLIARCGKTTIRRLIYEGHILRATFGAI